MGSKGFQSPGNVRYSLLCIGIGYLLNVDGQLPCACSLMFIIISKLSCYSGVAQIGNNFFSGVQLRIVTSRPDANVCERMFLDAPEGYKFERYFLWKRQWHVKFSATFA